MICIVPDFAGFPPSTAVSVSLMMDCFSLSKALFSTNSPPPDSHNESRKKWKENF
uniref:Uncharacterized protein n=1 Tax=Gouania willdenowi TaxID=441366 RepID=A0A8C5DM30_GOUWI